MYMILSIWIVLLLFWGAVCYLVFSEKNEVEFDVKSRVVGLEAVAIEMVLLAIISFFLAFIRRFSANYLLASISIFTLLLYGCCIKKRHTNKLHIIDIFSKEKIILMILLLIYVVFNVIYASEWTTGWRDYSGYYYQAVHIADEGSIYYENSDPYLLDNYRDIEKVSSLTYGGLYLVEGRTADFSFQFYHLYSSLLAVFYLLGKSKLLFVITPLISVCSLYFFYQIMLLIGKKQIALIATVVLALNPAQLWNSRITVSESLCQLLILLAVFTYYHSVIQKKKFKLIMSGILLSLIHLTKMDMYIVLAGVLCWLIYINLTEKDNKYNNIFGMVYLLFSVIWSIIDFCTNKEYLIEHWNMGVLDKIVYLCVGLLIVFCVVRISQRLHPYNIRSINIQYIMENKGFVKFFPIIWELILFIGIKWTYRNEVAFFSNLHKLSWYTSYILLILFPFGVLYIFSHNMYEKNKKILLFFIISSVNAVVYVYNPAIASDHMWASRRWFTIIIPFIICVGILGMNKIKYRAIKIVCLSCIIIVEMYGAREFAFTKILDGCLDYYSEIANNMEDDKAYFTTDKTTSVILKVVYNKNVYVLDKIEGVDEYLGNVGELYLISRANISDIITKLNEKYDDQEICDIKCELVDIERSSEHLPSYSYLDNYDTKVYLFKPNE